jgi:hypothetical protein
MDDATYPIPAGTLETPWDLALGEAEAAGLIGRPIELAPAGWFTAFVKALRQDGVVANAIERARLRADEATAGEDAR